MQIDGSITQPGLTSVKLQAYKPVENQQNTSAKTSGSDTVTLSQAAKDLASAEPMRGGGIKPPSTTQENTYLEPLRGGGVRPENPKVSV